MDATKEAAKRGCYEMMMYFFFYASAFMGVGKLVQLIFGGIFNSDTHGCYEDAGMTLATWAIVDGIIGIAGFCNPGYYAVMLNCAPDDDDSDLGDFEIIWRWLIGSASRICGIVHPIWGVIWCIYGLVNIFSNYSGCADDARGLWVYSMVNCIVSLVYFTYVGIVQRITRSDDDA